MQTFSNPRLVKWIFKPRNRMAGHLILVLVGLFSTRWVCQKIYQKCVFVDSEMIKCPRCHTLISELKYANYCIKCGEPLKKS